MTVDEYAQKTGYAPVHFIGEWKGYKVYEPDLYTEGDEPLYIGYPLVILEKDNNYRISKPFESLEILDYFRDDD